ncbi:MAG: hypothetical protein RSE12_16975 [Fuscovulum sp.]|nr:MAG: hypothetical protein RSE12_16975 [Fuscovulum sp.]
MALVKNASNIPLGITPEHMIPAGAEVEIADDIVTAAMNSLVVTFWIENGDLVIEGLTDKPKRGRKAKSETTETETKSETSETSSETEPTE